MALSKIVFDTNAYSALAKGDNKIIAVLNNATKILIPSFVITELLNGFRKGNKEDWNKNTLSRFESKSNVARIHPNNETIEVFVDLFDYLRRQGKSIPTHDIWIAALTIEYGCSLITYDKHFLNLPQLRVWKRL